MRLFFALVPDDDVRAAFARRAVDMVRAVGGRAVPEANLHATVVFIGNAGAGEREALRGVLRRLPRDAFTLELDRIGAWRAARVGWIGTSRTPPALAALHAQIAADATTLGHAMEARPYRPHVTLVRRPARPLPEAGVEPIAWRVRRVALMRSESADGGVRYIEDAAIDLAA